MDMRSFDKCILFEGEPRFVDIDLAHNLGHWYQVNINRFTQKRLQLGDLMGIA